MKIKVIKSSGEDYWYANRIGEEFEAEEWTKLGYLISNENMGTGQMYPQYCSGIIHDEDCVLVDENEFEKYKP